MIQFLVREPNGLFKQYRKLPPTSEVEELQFAIRNCNCNVKKEIKAPQWGGKLSFNVKR
jgi:hypothetical protein